MTARTFLVSGLLAGLIGGVVAFLVATTFGEPAVNQAIAVEEAAAAHEHADGHTHPHAEDEPAAITRDEQMGPGLATATLVMGAVLGGAAGIGAAFVTGRVGRLTPLGAGALAAALGFLAFGLVPFLKYPANPPAVGNPDTIGERTAAYWALIGISLVAVVVAVIVARRLQGRGTWTSTVAGAAAFAAIVGVACLALPGFNEVPDTFPANTLYDFRMGSLLTQASLWLTIGIALSGLLVRPWRKALEASARREMAASL